jgi:hypothetical protein
MLWFYIFFEFLYVQIASSHCTFFLLHILKMMVNAMMTLFPTAKCLALQYSLLLSTLLLLFFFQQFNFFLSPFVFTRLCFFLPCYYLQFLNRIFCIHASIHSRTSKTHIASNNKRKQVLTITSFLFILELLAYCIHFLTYPPSFK